MFLLFTFLYAYLCILVQVTCDGVSPKVVIWLMLDTSHECHMIGSITQSFFQQRRRFGQKTAHAYKHAWTECWQAFNPTVRTAHCAQQIKQGESNHHWPISANWKMRFNRSFGWHRNKQTNGHIIWTHACSFKQKDGPQSTHLQAGRPYHPSLL